MADYEINRKKNHLLLYLLFAKILRENRRDFFEKIDRPPWMRVRRLIFLPPFCGLGNAFLSGVISNMPPLLHLYGSHSLP